MITGVDNRLLFGALRNLKLAPHVREPPAAMASPAVSDSVQAAALADRGASVQPSSTAEKLELSARALALATSSPADEPSTSRPAKASPIERAYAEYGA